jgi:hypothetical protein
MTGMVQGIDPDMSRSHIIVRWEKFFHHRRRRHWILVSLAGRAIQKYEYRTLNDGFGFRF